MIAKKDFMKKTKLTPIKKPVKVLKLPKVLKELKQKCRKEEK